MFQDKLDLSSLRVKPGYNYFHKGYRLPSNLCQNKSIKTVGGGGEAVWTYGIFFICLLSAAVPLLDTCL